ncbi:hypothetical protein [Alteraurantiacibacter aestuarii]|uniref:hypothetical protein n=1 Tax=Alteraurantiacibacter aestuarii TaxID=650004 RepID=UPI003B026579
MTAGTLCRSERIARLNDRARQAMGLACVAVATEGFRALPDEDQSRVRELVHSTRSRRTTILMASAISGRSIRLAKVAG